MGPGQESNGEVTSTVVRGEGETEGSQLTGTNSTEAGTKDRIRTLQVDDDRDLVELTADYIGRQEDRLEILTATTVRNALDIIEREPIDCIVSDYRMEPTDGIEFLEQIRETDEELPFILLTGRGSEEVASEAISTGVTDYLQKGHGIDHYKSLANRITNAVAQYRSKQQVERSQKRLSLFFEQSRLGVIEWDENFETVRVNDSAEEILGYAEQELLGESWDRLVPTTDHDGPDDLASSLLDAEGGYRSTIQNIRKDGERIVCEWHNRVVTDDAGRVVAVFSQCQDVTDRKERKQAITNLHDVAADLAECESRNELYETTVEATNAMPAFDHAGIALQDGGKLQVQRASDIDIVEEASDCFEKIATPRSTDPLVINEFESADDCEIASLIHIPLDDQRVFQVYSTQPGAFEDKEGQMAELLAQHMKNELERLSYRRDLEAKKAKLEEQNDKLDEFISVVSHDLRNPIQVISGSLELAAETGNEEYFERCRSASERMEQLIDDLLTVAREQERDIETETVDIATEARNCWQTVDTADATLEIDIDRQISADRSRLNQLLENLFHNAIEHAGDNVTVTVGKLEDGHGFHIADDGDGIPETRREEVFEFGYTGSRNGTGLGLSIVAQVAEDHGWTIRATESNTGGAEFDVRTG